MIDLRLGDCLDVLKTLPDGCVDAVICDPPYPEISRPYGRMTEAAWHEMMRNVVGECRRILNPTGSAVFVLQPNSERVGRMRPWLWEFMAWTAREWNQVQDAWWWRFDALPLTKNDPNLMRGSVKACVWLGPENCYRDASTVLWEESQASRAQREAERLNNRAYVVRDKATRVNVVSDRARGAAERRGGVTPFNLLPVGSDGKEGKTKHAARTPLALCDWWVRYISPPEGVVCDPFMGSGTTGIAALKRGRSFIGIEKMPEYFAIAERRIAAARDATPLLTGAAQ